MDHWQWLDATTLQAVFAGIGVVLTGITIGVLIVTWRAIKRQALASEKLIEATERQIATSAAQAKAATEQVEVARRQIAESLRPILVARSGGIVGEKHHLKIKNEGVGVALDVWWTYGKPTRRPNVAQAHERVGVGILAPGMEYSFSADNRQVSASGISIIYCSLSGVLSVTEIERGSAGGTNIYHGEVDDDFKSLSTA